MVVNSTLLIALVLIGATSEDSILVFSWYPFTCPSKHYTSASMRQLVKRFGGAGEGLLRFLLGEAGNGTIPWKAKLFRAALWVKCSKRNAERNRLGLGV